MAHGLRICELMEFAPLKEGDQDRVVKNDDGSVLVKGVKLLGTESKNLNEDGTRNRYPAKHMPKWAPRYEGAPIYADHSRDDDGIRSVKDKIGRVQNVEARENGLFGDTLYAPGEYAERVAWAASSAPDFFSMSHHARGMGVREEKSDWTDVEEIDTVFSVDLVVAGGTTNSLYEHRKDGNIVEEPTVETTTVSEPTEVIVAEIEAPATVDLEQLVEAQKQIAELEKSLREANDEIRVLKRSALLSESGLPADSISDTFREAVREAASDEKAQELIEDRRALVLHQDPITGTPEAKPQEDQHSPKHFSEWCEA